MHVAKQKKPTTKNWFIPIGNVIMPQKPSLASLIIAKPLKNNLKYFVNVNFPSCDVLQLNTTLTNKECWLIEHGWLNEWVHNVTFIKV